ncbi:hypothetical protein LCGC14_2117510, partial [marine sediment metagenome]
MGKGWDKGVPGVEFWLAMLAAMKPGGHMVAFGGTRTHHRMWCAIEDAGFEVRDCLMWITGQGFPKSHNVAAALDRKLLGRGPRGRAIPTASTYQASDVEQKNKLTSNPVLAYKAESTEARQWEGWGTALKPSYEIVILAQKPYALEGERGIIVENLTKLEAQLWSLLPAKVAGESFRLSSRAYAEVCDFAQWTAAERSNTRDALCAQTDTSRFVSALSSCLNTVLSWSNTLATLSHLPSMSTIGTETGQTTDWKTLSSCVSALTLHTIIEAEMKAPGSRCAALPAAQYLNAVVVRQSAILELSALAPVISSGQAKCQAETDQGFSPAWEPILLARKPLGEKTVAANVLKHGVGGLNIDGCRLESQADSFRDQRADKVQQNAYGKFGVSDYD